MTALLQKIQGSNSLTEVRGYAVKPIPLTGYCRLWNNQRLNQFPKKKTILEIAIQKKKTTNKEIRSRANVWKRHSDIK